MRDQHPGVPLHQYRDQADVELRCCACLDWRAIPLEDVIARLTARGLNGPMVGVIQLSRYVEGPCAKCGATQWETRPHFNGERPTGRYPSYPKRPAS